MAYGRKMAPFGTRIRELRLSRGMTQTQLALAIGATQSAISKWERGERQDISLWQALAIANLIGISVEEMVGQAPLVVATAEATGLDYDLFTKCVVWANRLNEIGPVSGELVAQTARDLYEQTLEEMRDTRSNIEDAFGNVARILLRRARSLAQSQHQN